MKGFRRAHIVLLPSLLLQGRMDLQVWLLLIVCDRGGHATEEMCHLCPLLRNINMARLGMLLQVWGTGQDGVSPNMGLAHSAF